MGNGIFDDAPNAVPDTNGDGKMDAVPIFAKAVGKANPTQEDAAKLISSNTEESVKMTLALMGLNKDQARQNVILEFGFYIGKLGRENVCCLYKGDIELPSDLHGLCYLHFENSIMEVEELILQELEEERFIQFSI